MVSLFTSRQAKVARAAAQLSQGRVASDLGINRSYLSQFESGKLLLDDATLNRLRDYYSKHGARLESVAHARSAQFEGDGEDSNTERLRDGFLLPPEADENQVDALLNEYAENRRRIADMCNTDLRNPGFFGFGVDEEKGNRQAEQVLILMARNYTIVEDLQGHRTAYLSPKHPAEGKKKTVGDFVNLRLQSFTTSLTLKLDT